MHKISYNYGDGTRWLNISLGNAKIVYNGHRIKVDLVDMVETMKILKKEV
jgi:hypothetical protein